MIPFPNRDIPLVFINVADGGEQKSGTGQSVLNLAEVLVIQDVLVTLQAAGVEAASIGIITFYAAAVDAAIELLPQLPGVVQRFIKKVEIQTVDAYEGREKDFIILMCVRSNNNHRLGFLRDSGRMTVALTRAKQGLFVIGNRATLESSENAPSWGHFITHCQEKNVIVEQWPPQS
jgi:regulator of nonsense transcripts 1